MKEKLVTAVSTVFALPMCWAATPILTAVGLGGVGVLGFVHPYHWLFVGLAILLLVLSFYLNMVRRRTPANVAVFLLGAAFVVTMIGYTFLR